MRVTCTNADEFLECIQRGVDTTRGDKLFHDTIRVSIIRRPVDGSVRDAVKFDVVIQGSTVIRSPDNSEYLLEFGENCGRDYEDADAEHEGTRNAKMIKQRISDFARQSGWKVLPGIIGL